MFSEEPFSPELSSLLQEWHGDRPLPACCMCRLIRDQTEPAPRWITLKAYRRAHPSLSADPLFTHTYCPDCLRRVQDTVRQYFREQEEHGRG
jgi:hypothetical protein